MIVRDLFSMTVRLKPCELPGKHRDIVRQLHPGQSVRNAAKIVNKGVSTVQRVKVLMADVAKVRTSKNRKCEVACHV